MEILTLNRRTFTDQSTIGDLFFKGNFFCNTLEDTCRSVKIQNQTAIPAGRYEVVLDPSPRFKRTMPRLLDVPNYEGILIHWGNSPIDTDGCILVGIYNQAKPDWISSSRATFDSLLTNLLSIRDPFFITITGGIK